MTSQTTDFTSVTETPGDGISREAASMLYSRYRFATTHGSGRILEVACGSGQGLGYLATRGEFVCGGDITPGLLTQARSKLGPLAPLVRLDAHDLPFASGSFDTVLLFEALYYLSDPMRFFQEVRRVLAPGGVLVVSTINPEWSAFNPSPFATRYLTASELSRSLNGIFPDVRLLGGFPVRASGRDAWIAPVKRLAVRFHLVPKTMRGKKWLKRLFLGPLVRVPPVLTDRVAPFDEPVPLPPAAHQGGFKVLYVVARCPP